MQTFFRLGLAAVLLLCPLRVLLAQDLTPRAYLITPTHSNAVTLIWSFYGGVSISMAHSRSAARRGHTASPFSVTTTLQPLWPLGQHRRLVAIRSRELPGNGGRAERTLYRSGLVDSIYRLSVNLKGGPAMARRSS